MTEKTKIGTRCCVCGKELLPQRMPDTPYSIGQKEYMKIRVCDKKECQCKVWRRLRVKWGVIKDEYMGC